MDEFSLIEKYLHFPDIPAGTAARTVVGSGDDGSVIAVEPGFELVCSMDTLIAGRHFPNDADPAEIAFRALAVNMSDLAAMGADPACCHLSLTLPDADEAWLARFSIGLESALKQWQLQLLGGDTCRGELALTFHVTGSVPAGTALLRSGAREGDLVFVSGALGAAALALHEWKQSGPVTDSALMHPEPRLALGAALRGVASSCIDISDGLLADLGHIVKSSSQDSGMALRAELDIACVPIAPALQEWARQGGIEKARDWALSHGDDYELCFTAPSGKAGQIREICAELSIEAVQIGRIGESFSSPGIVCRLNGQEYKTSSEGYQHFST